MADDTALTWNDRVGDWMHRTIRNPGKALGAPDRQGCPTT